ncbi:MAG: tetratricopeptide repeat protein, partial [Blastocatellia bacterium]
MFNLLKRAASLLLIIIAICYAAAAADWNRGVSYYKKGDFRAALGEFREIAVRQPDSAGAWYYVGLCEFRLKEYKQVELPLSRAIELLEVQTPGSADLAGAWYTIGFSHYLLAEYDKAVEPLKKYGELTAKSGKPVDQNARRALGRSYYFLGRNDEAVAILAETSTASTGFDTAAGDKDAGKDTGLDTDKDKAQAAANLKESAADSYYLGAIYFKQGDNDKAITALQAAVKDRADDIAPVELLTEALMKRAVSTLARSISN